MNSINEQIDRLLHDAEHARSGAILAAQMGHSTPARELQDKECSFLAKAQKLFEDNPGSVWPDCDFTVPEVP